METILITGAGYVGSVIAQTLKAAHNIILIDKRQCMVPDGTTFFMIDCTDRNALDALCALYNIDAVIHTAAYIDVAASCADPLLYYENNIISTLAIIAAMRKHRIPTIIFSSSAAVYGNPLYTPLDEKHPCNPVSPYGRTKLMAEEILRDAANAYGITAIALRYFNVAGAWPEHNLGEQHEPETHILPRLFACARSGIPLDLYGTVYLTPDGSAIRDMVHVRDIAAAHQAALDYSQANSGFDVFNIASAKPTSMYELIAAVERTIDLPIRVRTQPNRAGDPHTLLASIENARTKMGWLPAYSDLEYIIASAWEFETNARCSSHDHVHTTQTKPLG